ncbi:Excitatory amino acid transporter 3 [Nibea albiflora]|uniref:Excitatory amino acid transporter 3 n=1 Tax=Nibea albiflora TaxID=240163 RepID=A0ACB7F402_NIBAL|nr:Excitatory amino acid transporter 3 [Nibea albiflora]
MENNETEDNNNSGSTGVLKNWRAHFQENKLLALSLAAVALGIGIGLILKTYVHLNEDDHIYISFPGEMLLRMLQLVTVPLIVTSVITGLILVLIFEPGSGYSRTKTEGEDTKPFSTIDVLLDLIRNMTPANLILACFEQNGTEVQLMGQYVDGANTLGLIVWSFVFGVTLNGMGEKGKVLVEILTVFNKTTKSAVDLILCYLPVGVLFLIANHVIEVHDWETTFKLLKFMVVVLIGLIIHGVIILPGIYLLCARRSPLAVIKGISPALMTALAISSSSATLPLTFQCCEERLKIDKRITRFMLPIGTNINMDGTALYEVVAVVFIAQLNHIDLNFSQLITLSDRCNTVINVMGDCIGVAVVNQLSKAEVLEMEQREQERMRMDGGRTADEIHINFSHQDDDEDEDAAVFSDAEEHV